MPLGTGLRRIRRAALNPERAVRALSGKLRQRISYWLGNGRSAPPAMVTLFLTYRCNLRCQMCDLWGEHGSKGAGAKESSRSTGEEMGLEDIRTLADELATFKPTVSLFGGEPFCRKDVIAVIECLRERGLRTSIVTNGVFLPQYYRELVDLGVDDITVSLDGPREVHDAIRGVPGTYDKAVAGIDAIAEYKRSRNRRTPRLKVLCTISDLNFRHLESFVAGLDGRELDLISFHHVMFVNEELLRRHNAVFETAFGTRSISLEGYLRDVSAHIGLDELTEHIARVKASVYRVPVEFLVDFTPEELRGYYTDFSFSPKSRCFVPWKEVLILPDGSVSPCLDFVAGNVRQESFLRIWNGPRYVHFRRTLKQMGKFPVCNRCCLLYRD